MICKQCGYQSSAGGRFCEKCGTAYQQPQPQFQQQPIQPAQPTQFTQPIQQQPVQQPAQPQQPAQFTQPAQPQQPTQFAQPQPAQPQQPTQPPQFTQPQQQPTQYTHFPQPPPYNPQATNIPPKKKSPTLPIVVSAVIVGVIVGLSTYNSTRPETKPVSHSTAPFTYSPVLPDIDIPDFSYITPDDEPQAALTPAEIFDNNKNAVFQIYLYENGVHVGYGSGFFVSPDGVAVTNHHVMDGINRATAVLYDGSEYDIIGYYSYDLENDLSVIQVDGKGRTFDYVTIGDPDALNVGDSVYAVGGPDGDPITFTAGIISRFATEPLSYGIYTVSGMLQSTASIYGGNSGGPLLNDKGEVVGINSAGQGDRDSKQWAVPVDRVVLPSSRDTTSSLPVGSKQTARAPGQLFGYEQFPFIPDFTSVSQNAYFYLGGSAEDMGFNLILDIDDEGVYNFDYVYYYVLENEHFKDETNLYDDVLEELGFIFQDGENATVRDYNVTYIFLYNPRIDLSVVYGYFWEGGFLELLIGHGNAYEEITGSSSPSAPSSPGGEVSFYDDFPDVPDFGSVITSATLFKSGYAYEDFDEDFFDGLRLLLGDTYISADDYVYYYSLPQKSIEEEKLFHIYLAANGFACKKEDYNENLNMYAAIYENSAKNITVSMIYFFDEEIYMVIIG